MSAKDAGAAGDGEEDDTNAIQRGIDRLAKTGGVLGFPPGTYRISRPLALRSGVSLLGSGRHYEVTAIGNEFTGSWIKGSTIELHSVQNCSIRAIGIDCSQGGGGIGISIGSDNRPACKSHVVEQVSIFGAELGVRWGLSNRYTPIEQCDDISFRDVAFHSCHNGFKFDAANGSDFSRIERATFDSLRGVAFDLKNAGFLTIENCAAGTLDNAIMFRYTTSGPDPIRIIGCQNEPMGRFLVAEGPNDQGTLILEGNVINLPVDAKGILRIVSRANYINSRISLDGYVRWSSYDDAWDPVKRNQQQVVIGNEAQFRATTLRDARGLNGLYLVAGTRIEGSDPMNSELVTKSGVYSYAFAPYGQYVKGDYFKSGNIVYRVEQGGAAELSVTNGRSGALKLRTVGRAAEIARLGFVGTG